MLVPPQTLLTSSSTNLPFQCGRRQLIWLRKPHPNSQYSKMSFWIELSWSASSSAPGCLWGKDPPVFELSTVTLQHLQVFHVTFCLVASILAKAGCYLPKGLFSNCRGLQAFPFKMASLSRTIESFRVEGVNLNETKPKYFDVECKFESRKAFARNSRHNLCQSEVF